MSTPGAGEPAGTMTTAVLKALANPTRRRVLRELTLRGSGRAADLAAGLGEPANRISFHLRALADAGLIEEVAELARDRRDRVWRVADHPRNFGSPEHPTPDAALGAAALTGLAADMHDLLDRVLRWAPEYSSGRDPVVRGALTQVTVHLTRPELEAMLAAVHEVVDGYRGRHAGGAGDGVHGWEVLLAVADDEI